MERQDGEDWADKLGGARWRRAQYTRLGIFGFNDTQGFR